MFKTLLGRQGCLNMSCKQMFSFNTDCWDFPGRPVVKTSPSNAGGVGSIPGQGAKIPHTSRPKP